MIVKELRIDGDGDVWPFDIPAIAQIRRNGLQITSPILILTGPNGSGKSTLLEGVAGAYGIDVRGGHGGRRYAGSGPGDPLNPALELVRTPFGKRMRGGNNGVLPARRDRLRNARVHDRPPGGRRRSCASTATAWRP